MTVRPKHTKEKAQETNQDVLAELRGKLQQIDLSNQQSQPAVSSGCEFLDAILPHNGIRPGQLVEWLAHSPGSGSFSWALQSCRSLAEQHPHQSVVIIDTGRTFYAPAAWGLLRPASASHTSSVPPSVPSPNFDLERVILVRPKNTTDALWALDQSLRSPSITAVCASIDRLESRDFRRLQLAAETGNTVGHLLRPVSIRGRPSWSDLQLLVQPVPSDSAKHQTRTAPPSHRSWKIELTRCRGGKSGTVAHVTGDLATGHWISHSPTNTQTNPPTNELTSTKPTVRSGSPLQESPAHSNHHAQPLVQKSNAMHLAAELARPASGHRATRA